MFVLEPVPCSVYSSPMDQVVVGSNHTWTRSYKNQPRIRRTYLWTRSLDLVTVDRFKVWMTVGTWTFLSGLFTWQP